MRMGSVEMKMLSSPPGKYGRKTETLRNWRGSTTRGAACGLIQLNAENLTRSDGRMKARLKTLPDEPRGSAWPSSARAVRCPAKSGNERDLRPQLLPGHVDRAHCGDRLRKEEEGAGYGRSVCSKSSRLHARNNGGDNGMQHREVKLNL